MIDSNLLFRIILFFAPVFSSLINGFIILLSYRESLNILEVKAKRLLIIYFSLVSFSSFSIFSYIYFPDIFIKINTLCYFSFIFSSIIFYQFVWEITNTNEEKQFSYKHYIIPALIFTTYTLWSVLIPNDIIRELTHGKGIIIPEYKWYSLFFISKPLARTIFGFFYTILSFFRLYHYRKKLPQESGKINLTHRWLTLVVGLTGILCIMIGLAGNVISREYFPSNILSLLTVSLLIFQQIVLTFNIMQHRLGLAEVSYTTSSTERKKTIAPYLSKIKQKIIPQKTKKAGKYVLNQKQFETYIKKSKPYLNPKLKITDLVEVFDTNRTYISNFINHTYDMNFNTYINLLRLREFERQQNLNSNKDTDTKKLIIKCGFSDIRSYQRIKNTVDNYKK